MSRPPRLHLEGALYHVTARGNERRLLFRDAADYGKYLSLLRESGQRLDSGVLAYCLLPNHVELVVRTGPEPLSFLMKAVHAEFARYFNKRHGRTGPLFEGRYRAILLERDAYLSSAVRYVHLNPVKAGIVTRPERYEWCSHAEYLRAHAEWLSTREVLESFEPRRGARKRFHAFVTGKAAGEGRSYSPEDAALGAVLGSEAFRKKSLRQAGQPRLFPKTLSLQRIVRAVTESEGVTLEDLMKSGRSRGPSRLRALCAALARDLAGIPIAETARFFNRDGSTLWRNVIHFEEHLDPKTERRIRELRKTLVK